MITLGDRIKIPGYGNICTRSTVVGPWVLVVSFHTGYELALHFSHTGFRLVMPKAINNQVSALHFRVTHRSSLDTRLQLSGLCGKCQRIVLFCCKGHLQRRVGGEEAGVISKTWRMECGVGKRTSSPAAVAFRSLYVVSCERSVIILQGMEMMYFPQFGLAWEATTPDLIAR